MAQSMSEAQATVFQGEQPNQSEIIAWAQNLTKKFGTQTAVENLNFEVPRGAIFGFIGPSGCGKTTTIRLMTGIYAPTSGEVNVLNRVPAQFTKRDRERLGYLTQGFIFYPDLTVWENLNFAASLYGVPFRRSKRLMRLLEFVELAEHKDKLARNLSGGMQRRLGLAATLIHKPELLFLDEPTAGIDPILRRKIWDYFEELRAEGYTMIITTQYVGEAAYCDLVAVMAKGNILLVDTPEGMRRRAFGGDVVHMRLQGAMPAEMRQSAESLPFVIAPPIIIGSRELRLVVDEANTAIPKLMEWARGNNLEIESIGEHLPPFDDVFVKLVKQEEREIDA